MIEWFYVNTPKINKMAYNAEIKTMYIDFYGSTVDTPFKNVPKNTFLEFSQAYSVDEYYEKHIKTCYEKVKIGTENSINFNFK